MHAVYNSYFVAIYIQKKTTCKRKRKKKKKENYLQLIGSLQNLYSTFKRVPVVSYHTNLC